MPQAPQAIPKFDSELADPKTGFIAIPWQYFFTWVYQQLGGQTGASATGLFVPPPVHVGSPGMPGQIAFDSGFLYVCVGVNSWKRVALSGGF